MAELEMSDRTQALVPGQQMMAAVGDVHEVELGEVPCSAKVASFPPCCWLCTCYTVAPNTVTAVLHCGVLTSMQVEEGLHFDWPGGMSKETVSVKQLTMDLPTSKVTDADGSPVLVSAILNYRVVDAKKALFSVDNYMDYVKVNASAVLKNVVGAHTYEGLKSQAEEVNRKMAEAVAPAVAVAGVMVVSMSMNELNYAPEIAASMLKKQQAAALIEARELIVDGAVKIAQDAIAKLEAAGTLQMNDADKIKIVTNLLTVTCSDQDAAPTINCS